MDAILDIIKNSPEGCTPLDIENIKQIICTNDINIQDSYGCTTLGLCCGKYYNNNNIKVIELLLMNNANVNIQDNDGTTALLYCCKKQDIENIKLLIENKANVNLKSHNGFTALIYASLYTCGNDIEIAKLLLKNDADVNIKNKRGDTAIMLALHCVNEIGNGNLSLKMIQLLLEYDAKLYDTRGINIFADNIAKLNVLS